MSAACKATEQAPTVEQRLYQYPGAQGYVLRWFVPGNPHPFHTQKEAQQVLAVQHERRGQA